MWEQLELDSGLESDLRDIPDWDRKWPIEFNAGKTQFVSFDQSNKSGAIDVKMGGIFLKQNNLLG